MQVESGRVPSRPYLADVGVIALVPERWGGPWLSRHQILTRLAMYFNVVWLNPAYTWRRLLHSRTRRKRVDYDGAITSGITIYNPERWLLELGRPHFLARWSMRQRLRRVQQILLTRRCRKTILYLWRPHHELALYLIDCDLSCYHMVDEYTFSAIEKPLGEEEAQLISRVDQVFIHSPALLEKKGNLNPHTAFVPNGVDYRAYATAHDEPTDLKPIPHPRIGYVGIIKTQLDLTLLSALAQRHPQWSFVFVGPQGNLVGEGDLLQKLSSMTNVYLLGGKPVSTLPAYTQHMDVCMLCYKMNDYTKFIYPLKLHEYLASGRPVVGSRIRSLEEFAHTIRLARTTDEWSQALNDMLAPAIHSAAQVEARRRIAQQHDWNTLVERIARTLCSRLGPAYLERFESISAREGALPR
jgi:glycosyltransferase involved in cell wall biosynthesis